MLLLWSKNKGNSKCKSTYVTKSGKRRTFECQECGGIFSETRDTVFFNLRASEEKVIMALKVILVPKIVTPSPKNCAGNLCICKWVPHQKTDLNLVGLRRLLSIRWDCIITISFIFSSKLSIALPKAMAFSLIGCHL